MQLLQDQFNEFNFFIFVDFLNSLVINLVFYLLDAVLLRYRLFFDPFRFIGDQRSYNESEGEQDILNHEDRDDEPGPGPFTAWAE